MMSHASYDALGFAGGVIIAVGLVPQIVKTVLTRSAIDISYTWQGIYALGIAITLVYAYGLKIYPVAIPLTLELFFILTLVALKVAFDRRSFEKIDQLSQEGQGDDGGATELPSRPQSRLMDPAEKATEAVRDQTFLVTEGSASTSPEAASLAEELSFGTKETAQMTTRQVNNFDDTRTWHGGDRLRRGSRMLRAGSLQKENGNSEEGTWHETGRGQRLVSLNTRSADEEVGRMSPRVIVRVIDAQSPLQRWL
eukprot:TRINITY_DN18063_c0_g1_i1.p1 TRINITY_DN18063_c0_g1~~TRINITY_DN18063_c0_g1_i1.p1  ORF type:complete len:253 (+),score=12.26 TRINITY_DN18063_c0_g1_i1:317-1075(+)